MGKKATVMVVCAVVGVLALVTILLGIIGAASAAQSLVKKDNGVFGIPSCEFEAGPAVGCGVVAGLLAMTTQIVASAATGCCGCCRAWGIPSEAKRIVAVVLSTFSWVLAIIVVILFFVGAMVSSVEDVLPNGDGKCVPPGTGVFVAATIMFVIVVVFQIISYILLQATTPAPGSDKPPLAQEQGITMAQQKAPTVNADQQKAAADGGVPPPSALPAVTPEDGVVAPPSAPAVRSEDGVVAPPPPATTDTESSSKASGSAEPTSQV